MKYISLASQHAGWACATSFYINKHIYSNTKEREFFDLITCSLKSVNEVLLMKEIQFNNIASPFYKVPNSTENLIVEFKGFHSMTTFHDFCNLSQDSINHFKQFYKNLQNKLINDIMTQDKIYFFRTVTEQADLQEDDIHDFYRHIHNMNGNLKFYFIILCNRQLKISENLKYKGNFILFNFSDYLIEGKYYNENIFRRIIDDYEWNALYNILKVKCNM